MFNKDYVGHANRKHGNTTQINFALNELEGKPKISKYNASKYNLREVTKDIGIKEKKALNYHKPEAQA